MKVLRTVADLRGHLAHGRRTQRVSLVPTMGALHDGHLALVKAAQSQSDQCVVSIFVNPTQFAPQEDLATYPRDDDRDLALLQGLGVDVVFMPDAAEMYPPGDSTRVDVTGLGSILEGEFRPHFFTGVATVCAKLLIQVSPDLAVFGEKDYQQLCVIRALVRDLYLPVEIIGVGTVREHDGLALSSRNAYLSEIERGQAPALFQAMNAVAERLRAGDDEATAIAAGERDVLQAGFSSVDYIAVRDAVSLESADLARPCRILAAAWLGRTRLIDNIAIG